MKIIFLAAICLMTGCLARPHLDKESFTFALPSRPAAADAHSSRVVRVRSLQVAPPFEGRALVYRTGEFSYDRDPYAQFMVAPAEALLGPICQRWRGAGAFDAVSEAGSALKPNMLVEIHVEQLYGDFRPGTNATAVLAMRFVFFEAPHGMPGTMILQQEYSRAIPLPERTAAALVEGWNQALAEILDGAATDFKQADAGAARQ